MDQATRPRDLHARLDELGLESVLDRLIDGQSVRAIARDLNASAASILAWLDREPGRMRRYQLARQAQADAWVDEIVELADEPVPIGPDGRMDPAAVNDKRLRIDARKWVASRFRPGMYGDRVAVEATTAPATMPKPEEVMAKITAFLASNGLRLLPDSSRQLTANFDHVSDDLAA